MYRAGRLVGGFLAWYGAGQSVGGFLAQYRAGRSVDGFLASYGAGRSVGGFLASYRAGRSVDGFLTSYRAGWLVGGFLTIELASQQIARNQPTCYTAVYRKQSEEQSQELTNLLRSIQKIERGSMLETDRSAMQQHIGNRARKNARNQLTCYAAAYRKQSEEECQEPTNLLHISIQKIKQGIELETD